MPKRKKHLKNNRKGRKGARRVKFSDRIIWGFKFVSATAAVMIVTGFFILVHDLVTHVDYFQARHLTVEGMHRLSSDEVAQQAGVHTGMNILSANLSLARKRLLAHPWIAEAEVSREIPSGLTIRIREHRPLAMVDFGDRYLMNTRGEIFKAWQPSDPADLPLVSGLDLSDLKVYGRTQPPRPGNGRNGSEPYQSVMRVLQLGEKKGSVLPNRVVKQIHVDRQIGLTVFAFDRIKTIYLGYSDYASKYRTLASLFSYIRRHQSLADFKRIDLNNLQRVVIGPIIGQDGNSNHDRRNPKQ